MAGMAGVLEEVIPKIDEGDIAKHFACYCGIEVTLCGITLEGQIYYGPVDSSEWSNCIDCYTRDIDPYYKCPKCGE